MKNRISESLNQELRGVRVSPELRRRILAEARSERHSRRRRRFSALSAVAAMLVIALAVVGGLKMLRRPAPDRKSSPGDYTAVWLDEVDRLYHSKRGCVDRQMTVAAVSEARARGYSACRKCIPVIRTPEPEATLAATETPSEIESESLLSTDAPIAALEPETTQAPIPTAEPTAALETPVPTEAPAAVPTAAPTDAASVVLSTVSVTIEPDSTPVPNNGSATFESVYADSDDLVYVSGDESVTVFHLDPADVPGNAITMTRAEALMDGYLPCESCGANDALYWMTAGGTNFHTAQNCRNMANAYQVTALDAIAAGKSACKVCIDQEAVWMTDGGLWYHAAEHCQNMMGAKQVARSVAENDGKSRCPFCFVSPEDSSWLEQISPSIYTDFQAFAADGKLMLSITADTYVLPLYGDPIALSDLTQRLLELSSIAGETLPEYVLSDAAQEIAAGNQIGLRALCYEVSSIRVYDDSGEISHGSVRKYRADFADSSLLYTVDLDESRTPTRVSVDLSVYGVSYYLDDSDEWQTIETPYAYNISTDDTGSSFYLSPTGNSNAAPEALELGVTPIARLSYALSDGCTLDAYSTDGGSEFALAILTDTTDDRTLLDNFDTFSTVYTEYTGADALVFESIDGNENQRVLLMDPTVSQRTLSEMTFVLRRLLGGSTYGVSGTTIPAASAARAEIKSAVSDSSSGMDAAAAP